jgi:hypothetical protein
MPTKVKMSIPLGSSPGVQGVSAFWGLGKRQRNIQSVIPLACGKYRRTPHEKEFAFDNLGRPALVTLNNMCTCGHVVPMLMLRA